MKPHITRRHASVASIVLLLVLSPMVAVITVQPASASVYRIDSFEDEPADEGTPEGWTLQVVDDNTGSGYTEKYIVQKGNTPAADQYLNVTHSDSFGNDQTLIKRSMPDTTPDKFSFWTRYNKSTGTYNDQSVKLANSTGFDAIAIDLNDGGSITTVTRDYSKTIVSNQQQDKWYEIVVENITFGGDADIKAKDTNGDVVGSVTVPLGNDGEVQTLKVSPTGGAHHYDAFSVNGGLLDISGTVEEKNGPTVENATVQVVGVNYSALPYSDPDKLNETAQDKLDKAKNPIPGDWKPNLALTGPDSLMKQAEKPYVAVHYRSEWQTSGNPDLSDPKLNPRTDNALALTVWNPAKEAILEDKASADLPGGIMTDQTVVLEQLGPNGSVLDTKTRDTRDITSSTGFWDYENTEFAPAALNQGFYRIYPKGHKETSYVIAVGDPQNIETAFRSQLRDKANSLSSRAAWIQDQISKSKLYNKTVATDANGKWSAAVPGNVKLVGATAYKGLLSQLSKDPQNITMQDVQALYQTTDVESSLYIPASTERVRPPESGVTLTVREATFPTFANSTQYGERIRSLRGLLRNQSQRISDLLQNLNNTNQDLQNLTLELANLSETNQRLKDRIGEINGTTGDKFLVSVRTGIEDASNSELRSQIATMEQAIDDLRNTIPTETTSSTSAEAVSSTATFGSVLNASQVSVLAHYSNGSTQTVPDSYVSVSQSTLSAVPGTGSTTVAVEDFPLGSASSVQFEWIAANSNGHASVTERVSNPAVSADPPEVNSVTLSSLAPGPDDAVQVSLNPAGDSTFKQLESATVYGPSGTSLATGAIQNGKSFNFTTAGQGRHILQLTYSDVDGNNWTRTVHIGADSVDRDRPASIKAQSGPTGIYALAGDGLDGGDVETRPAHITLTAQVAPSADVPAIIHGYTGPVSESPSGSITFNVQRTTGKSVDTPSKVILHTTATPDEGTFVYRNGRPITPDGTVAGTVEHMSNQTLITTHTGDTGTVTVTIKQPQGLIDTTYQRARWEVAKLQLQLGGITSSIGGISVGWVFLVLIPAGALGARRRGRGGNGGAAA